MYRQSKNGREIETQKVVEKDGGTVVIYRKRRDSNGPGGSWIVGDSRRDDRVL